MGMNKKWKRFGLVSLAILAVIAMTSFGTLALFTDALNLSGKVTAGTMDLVANGANAPGQISVTNMKPGETRKFNWNLKNIGSVDGHITAASFAYTQTEGAAPNAPELAAEDADGTGDLDEVLMVQVYINGVPQFKTGGSAAWQPLSGGGASGNYTIDLPIAAGAELPLEVQLYWPETTAGFNDNKAQGDTLEGTVSLNFVQTNP